MKENNQIFIEQIQESLDCWKTVNAISEVVSRKNFQLGKEVHVWYTSLIQDIDCYDVLSLGEKRRASRFRSYLDQQYYINSHGILRHILSAYINMTPHEITFHTSDYGKPFLSAQNRESQIQFNMSHSKDIACYIVSSKNEVGVDIEYIDDGFDWYDIANYSLSLSEITFLKSLPKNQQKKEFFTLWTQKEALLKAKGTGMNDIENISKKESLKEEFQLGSFGIKEGLQGAFAINKQNASICYFQFPFKH
jgi:4'-phosphopantetheinyl transferase